MKRRKVWVNCYGTHWGTHLSTKADVLMAAQEGAEQVHLVEHRRGDVVLSKDVVERLWTLFNEAARDGGRDSDREAEFAELLQGRR